MSGAGTVGSADGVEVADRPTVMACDFCHQEVPSVRRVALDGDYERLQTPHSVMYSCPDCFEKKDRQRMGI